MGRRKKPEPKQITVIRYETPDGKRCAKDTPGAVKRTVKTDAYYAQLPPKVPRLSRNGKPVLHEWFPLETTDIGAAWKALDKELEERAREAAGITDPLLIHAGKLLSEHIADWIAQLRAGGRTGEDQVKLLDSRVRNLAALARWERLSHITRDSTLKALAALQKERVEGVGKEYEGRSNRTRNHYLRHIKQFCTWLVEEGRLSRSPVQAIDGVNVEVDIRHARRAPTTKEVALLMAYCEGALTLGEGEAAKPVKPATRCGLTGPQRGLGYRLCMATGFRAKELRTLTEKSFDLEAGSVTCRAAYGKNRKLVTMPLPAWLVGELKAWLAAGGDVWTTLPKAHPGRVLKKDLVAAGIEYKVEGPEGVGFFDFHALRHWYITVLANIPGISPKTLMTLARHSDPDLTLRIYAKQRAEADRAAANLIPDLAPPSQKPDGEGGGNRGDK